MTEFKPGEPKLFKQDFIKFFLEGLEEILNLTEYERLQCAEDCQNACEDVYEKALNMKRWIEKHNDGF